MARLRLKKGSNTQRDGARGETLALWYLRLHGYHLLERNYLVGHKEIDIIMQKKDVVAFVEVKARRNIDKRMPPRLSVDYNKQRNIIFASKTYEARARLRNVVLRYDIVEVDLSRNKVIHIKNAFSE